MSRALSVGHSWWPTMLPPRTPCRTWPCENTFDRLRLFIYLFNESLPIFRKWPTCVKRYFRSYLACRGRLPLRVSICNTLPVPGTQQNLKDTRPSKRTYLHWSERKKGNNDIRVHSYSSRDFFFFTRCNWFPELRKPIRDQDCPPSTLFDPLDT